MSQSDLLKALRAQVAFDERTTKVQAKLHADTFGDPDNPEGWDGYPTGARVENARLAPLLSSLIAVVEAAEQDVQTMRVVNALEDLRAAVGMGEK